MKKFCKRWMVMFMSLCCLLCVSGCRANADVSDVKLYCLNIGKADCLILCCAGRNYLIDAGYEHTYPALETALSSLNIHHLDGVFLTHCHEDHQGGLMQLAKSDVAIDHFYAASIYHDVKENEHPMILAAKERGMDVEWLSSGDIIQIADGYSFRVLGPLQANTDNENNNSLVMYFSSPHGSILFTGDMKDEEENELMYDDLLQPCDVLKVAHHGDNGATSKAFINTVRPKYAIISTHPKQEPDSASSEVLFRLARSGCETYISYEYIDAIGITLHNGEVSTEEMAWHDIPKWHLQLGFEFDENNNILTLSNNSYETIRLSGCILYLSRKDEVVALDDITLEPNTSFIIGGKKANKKVDMKLNNKKVLHDKKLDVAIIYDANGRLMAICNNGQEE